ncbi:MAG: hypothetical protein IBJ03_19060 [Gemmatimonadaceae bacterium]|nr:hypothetical protein [Gemmatimonadaceae bacterium]
MRRWASVRMSALLLMPCVVALAASPVEAQEVTPPTTAWRHAGADSLVARAIARRGVQLADSTLLSYTANAHGFLAFLAQLGEGVVIPPRVVQSEELALQIAWWQPGRSAQRLVGRRDTTLLPADVGYYRDRYGVVLDNLPDRIRLGDGQDVRDVPHPLAANAATIYEYALGRPLRISIPGREILVDEVKFRPRNAEQPGAIGSVYLDHETGAVVRLSMTFTRAAIIDKRIETLVVTLENGLVREKYWLPRRQEVEVSRGSTWFDIPARGIVRGRWEIAGYTVNERIPPATQQLPRWSSMPRDSLRAHVFEGRMIDVLPPEIQMASSEDVVQARVQAEAAVRAAMLARPATASVTGRGISDLARFSRAEGLALGIGASHRSSAGFVVHGRARYGFADEAVKGHVAIGPSPAFGRAPTLQLFAERDYLDLAFAERAGVTNSAAAALFGSDYTTQVDTRAAGVLWRRAPNSAFTWRLAYETDRAVTTRASSLSRDFAPSLNAWPLEGVRGEVRGTGGWVPGDAMARRGVWSLMADVGAQHGTIQIPWGPLVDPLPGAPMPTRLVQPLVGRMQAQLQLTQPLPGDRALFLHGLAGVAGGRDLPPQWLVMAGGPWSAPGYDWHAFGARALISTRLEFRTPIPAPSIPLRRFGKSPPHATLAPYVQALATSSGTAERPTVAGVYPSAGVGLLFFYDLLRVDVARGLRQGSWRFAIDIDRSFWGML